MDAVLEIRKLFADYSFILELGKQLRAAKVKPFPNSITPPSLLELPMGVDLLVQTSLSYPPKRKTNGLHLFAREDTFHKIKKRRCCKREICFTMACYVEPLRQISLLKFAVQVCNSAEIRDFVKENGCESFVFPSKETYIYLNGKDQVDETWTSKNFLIQEVFPKSYVIRNRILSGRSEACSIRNDISPFARWEKLVEKTISSFSLPQRLRSELLDVVRSVSIEIDRWIKDHSRSLRNSLHFAHSAQSHFQWNALGRIDRERTASMLIANKRLDIEERYLLAIYYGLTIPIEERVPYIIVQKYSNLFERRHVPPQWSSSVVDFENRSVARTDWFSTLNPKERVLYLKKALSEECLQFEDLRFYLTYMSDDERKKVFKVHAFRILSQILLDWPLQYKFLKAAKDLLPYFTESDFLEMLRIILNEKILLGRKDFNYINLLKQLWSMSPSELKESIKTDSIYEPLMFTINFPVHEKFPNEQLFQWYDDNCLKFGYSGLNYCVFKDEIDPKKWLQSDDFKFYCKYRFVNASVFLKNRKRKHEESASTGSA
ncbi:uncharacterized protein TNCT_200651 [Trichonephila clavata]|uniref:Uncharacterized protein n=1 Tax=Trichonephila clavata TaxID=2740835 RepID=A0A8X6KIJ5_TRICU|nr:uncharacterized protein TNCT_200651 [Trichonephila clavata]